MTTFAEAPAGPIRFLAEGPADAPLLLLIHPLGVALEFWDQHAAALRNEFRVIRYDLRGHGRSVVPAGDYTIDDLGRDALAVLDAAGARTAHIVGISIGGLIAMWLGIHAGRRAQSLLVAQSAARIGTVERWEERRALVRERGLAHVAHMAMGAWFTSEFAESDPEAVDRCRQMIASCHPAGYLGCCAALRDADLRADLPRITTRTMLLAGLRDPSTTLLDAEFIVGAVPGAQLTTLPCAHMSAVERPDAFLRIVEAWVKAPANADV